MSKEPRSHDDAAKRPRAAPRRVIIDTDPGIDDMLAILLAFGSTDIVVEGLTIVCGNGKDIKKLGANARLLTRIAGCPGVPVSLGDAPLDETEAAQAAPVHVHGEDGLGGVAAEFGRTEADFSGFASKPAARFLADTCAAYPGEITIVAIGPLSNVAAALALRPELPQIVRELVIMGGAVHGELRGNRTAAAEANFAADPDAAQAVLTAGFSRCTLADLGMTHQTDMVLLREACRRELPDSAVAKMVYAVCQCYIDCYLGTWGQPKAPAHDAVPIMYLLRPDLFSTRRARVEVELQGSLTRGMSVADWGGRWQKPNNCEVLMVLKQPEQFVSEFVMAIRRLPRS